MQAARAVVADGAEADLILGRQPADASHLSGPFVAVDPSTQKVFVGDSRMNRILRFSSGASLQNGAAAEAVLGQTNFNCGDAGNGPDHFNMPAGMCLDNAGRLWVADAGNNRVLRFNNAATIGSGVPANGVLGQVNFENTDPGTAAGTFYHPLSLVTDLLGNLYVADSFNNRVLRFNNAAALPDGPSASAVLGQSGYSTSSGGKGSAKFQLPGSLAISPNPVLQGSPYLWVADIANNRVLLFSDAPHLANGAAALRVLGQLGFNQTDANITQTGTPVPYGLAADSSGRLYVGSQVGRIVRFDNAVAKASGAPADGVLGQPSFNTIGMGSGPGAFSISTSLAIGTGGRLWISDYQNDRVLRHEAAQTKVNGADADGVIGDASTTMDLTRNFRPGAMAIDPGTGKLFVTDTPRHRVLRFANVRSLASGAAAEAVFGQLDFNGASPATAAGRMWSPSAITVDHFGILWVADTENNRVLRFNNISQRASGVAADAVFGQSGFNSNSIAALSARTIVGPISILAGAGGELWVETNGRLLRFDNARNKGGNPPADVVLGQPAFDAYEFGMTDARHFSAASIALDGAGRLWVMDNSHSRILRFDGAAAKPTYAPADGVLGQSGMTSVVDGGLGPDGVEYGFVCAEPGGRLWFVDGNHNRALRWEHAASRLDGADADGVLGQPDFGFEQGGTGPGQFNGARQMVRDNDGCLWIADGENGRILRFSPTVPSLDLKVENPTALSFTCGNLVKGVTYQWQSSPDLTTWQDAGSFSPDANGPAVFTLPKPAAARWFYRLAER